jgi:hypothetical protein
MPPVCIVLENPEIALELDDGVGNNQEFDIFESGDSW